VLGDWVEKDGIEDKRWHFQSAFLCLAIPAQIGDARSINRFVLFPYVALPEKIL
jgi:hypothetical protein